MRPAVASKVQLVWTGSGHWPGRVRGCRPRCGVQPKLTMSSDRSFSIWLMPDPASSVNARLEQEVSHWSGALAPDAPVFKPHVTLIGGVTMPEACMIAKTEELAKRLRKYFLSFADVDRGSIRHQCVYIRCNKEAYTMQAAALATEVFGLEAGPYMPHCSIVYADITADRRAEVAALARERLYGNAQGFQSLLIDTGFWAGALHVFDTGDSDERKWREIACIQLPEAAS
eukprot:jgi/Ulvmu1/12203/UM085_0067.1